MDKPNANNIAAKYEACRLLAANIKDLVKNKKIDKVPNDMLEALSGAFGEIIEFAKLVLILKHDPFIGTLFLGMNCDIDFRQDGAIDVDVKADPVIIKFNPLRCCDYNYNEFEGLLVAELVRIAVGHPADFADLNPSSDDVAHIKLEMASDVVASNMVQEDIRNIGMKSVARLPHDAFTPTRLNALTGVTAKRDQDISYYYKVIDKFAKPDGNGGGNGQQGGSDGSSKTMGKDEGEGNSNQNSNVSFDGNPTGKGTHQWDKGDAENTRDKIKALVQSTLDSMSDKKRGMMGASHTAAINALLEPPEIDWKQYLRRLVGTVPVPYRKTRTKLNRRQPFRADMCGKLPRRTVNVVCAIDTSGSMSDSVLSYCMNEVFNIVKAYDGFKVTIIECDAEIQRVYTANSINDVKLDMRGRGGTSFVPVIDFINGAPEYKSNPMSGKFKDALLVYFTDGYGDSEIPKPKTFKNLWVVLNDTKNLSLAEPYGEVKALTGDKQYMKKRNLGEF